MLRTVEVRWLEQGSGWGRCCGRSRAAGDCLRRWQGAEATMATSDGAACGDCELLASGAGSRSDDGDWRWRAACDGEQLVAMGRKRWGPWAMVDGGRVVPLSLCRLFYF
ncbi:unnamed protein product [Linum trigynum]|uniref:Uncharacterized protein n=1 Tax=Linum trigynum TaxID=586398 RepID=A0AAV2FNS7_9ROSI